MSALAKVLVLFVLALTWCGCACAMHAPDVEVLDGEVLTPDVEVLDGEVLTPDTSTCSWTRAQQWHRDCCDTHECLGWDDRGGPTVACVHPPASSRTTCQPQCDGNGECPSGLVCLEDGWCWALCRPSPGVVYDCPSGHACVLHGTAVTAPYYVCQGPRL